MENTMRLADINPGMKLLCIGDYADCIHTGRTYEALELDGEMYITCDGGEGDGPQLHNITDSCDDKGEWPEFVPL